MLSEDGRKCRDCRGDLLLDQGDVVCSSCGLVADDHVGSTDIQKGKGDGRRLGSFLGPMSTLAVSSPLVRDGSTTKYLKKVSDNMGWKNSDWQLDNLIARICEKLRLNQTHADQARLIARRLRAVDWAREYPGWKRPPSPAVSAFSLAKACTILGTASVTSMDVVEAHRLLGYRVRTKHLIHLAVAAGGRIPQPAGPRDFLSLLVTRLSTDMVVVDRLTRKGVDRRKYFADLLETARRVMTQLEKTPSGRSGLSKSAVAVYAASVVLGGRYSAKGITQADAARAACLREYTVRENFGALCLRPGLDLDSFRPISM